MLISNYLSSNNNNLYSFLFDHKTKIEKYFRSIFGSNENFKIGFRDYLTFNKTKFALCESQVVSPTQSTYEQL